MGGSSKTSSSQSTTLNDWSKQQFNDLSGKIGGLLSNATYKPYTGDLSAGPNAMTQQAGQAVGGLLGFQPQQVQAQSFKDADLSGYLNPQTDAVVNAALGDIEHGRQMQRVNDSQSATAAGAWGGSRHGVADSLTNDAAIRAGASAAANLRSQAYDRAADLFNQDANRSLSAGQFNANMGLSGAQFGLGAAGLLGQLGNQDREFDQQELDRLYGEFIRSQDAPYKQAQGYLGLLGATPMLTNVSGTSKSKQGVGLGQIIGTATQIGSALLSDRRAKENVSFVGADEKGRRWYDYSYIGDPAVHRGVMAQDLLEQDPQHPAVSVGADGFYRVDYGAL